jgi:signal transduction histidine kinase
MIDVLSEIDLFDGVDPDLVDGFLAKGKEMQLEVGEKLFKEGVRLGHFSIILEGAVEWSRRVNGVDVVVGRREAPTYAGAGNALTGDPPVATGVVIEPMRLLRWSAEDFREFIQQAPTAMETTVRLIGPVAQMAESTVRQQEKLAALGTLSAGLAHEMNNPAAAARRTASELGEALDTLLKTVHRFVSSGVEREDAAVLVELQIQAMKQAKAGVEEDAIAAADREDALAGKIDEMGYEGWRLAEPLARARLDNEWLERLAAHSGSATGDALEWVAASLTAHTLVEELHESTERISHLVGAVKDYTYMDRMQIDDLDIHDGIDNTLTILGYRLKHCQVKVVRDYDRSLPRITARGSELNQVWTNLLSNALDALDGQGTITITTRMSGPRVAVDIEDDGPGIPAEIQSKIFDPFFTTKPVGKGTGLGLDIARRIVVGHRGNISVKSQPGTTRFTVMLPVNDK